MVYPTDEEHVDDQMVTLQANIDDMNPEFTSYVTDQLFVKGAYDVYWIPIIMKKGRPGIMLNVLIRKDLLPLMEEVIFQETTTLGVRYMPTVCHRLGRKWVDVKTEWGVVPVKLAYYQGELVQYAPEFKVCEQIAKYHQVPIKVVYDTIRKLVLNR